MSRAAIQWHRFTPKVLKPGAAPLLLIHGFGCGAADWGAWPKVLGARAKREVLYFDNRGVGASSGMQGPYTVPQMVADAHAVVEAAGASRVSVMGISLGGMVAQSFALSHPQSTAALILGCTTHGSGFNAFTCPHHACGGCGRKAGAAGGMLFRCEACPSCYCEDLLPAEAWSRL